MGTINGQSSGDNRLSSGAMRVLYSVIRGDSTYDLSDDSFTAQNPGVVTAAPNKSTTIPVAVKNGALGGSVAFSRPELAAHSCGVPVLDSGNYIENTRPLGLFLNDAVGNPYENTPAVGSGKSPFIRGGTIGVKIYETQQQIGGAADLAYEEGQHLYASVNGYLTNRWQDSYEAQWITAAAVGSGVAGAAIEPDVTRMGLVESPPDSSSSEMIVMLFSR